jgi:hypothetical protein
MHLIDRTDSLEILGDTIFLSVGGILPDVRNVYYRFELDVSTPGMKVCFTPSSIPRLLIQQFIRPSSFISVTHPSMTHLKRPTTH